MSNVQINSDYATAYNRAFTSIRNRIGVSTADIGRTIRVRVLGNGAMVSRPSGQMVKLFNTNVMESSALPAVIAKLQPAQFNLVADAGDEADVTKYLREAQNLGNLPFSVPLTNSLINQIGQGATVEVTIAEITIQSGERAGQKALALNFNRVVPAENGTGVASAFDALLAGTSVDSAPAEDPFASTSTSPANETAAQKKARLAAEKKAALQTV